MAGETPFACFSAYVLDCILSLSDSSVCLPQSVVVASISLQAANLYGYLRCKAGGQDGHPPDNRSFTGQQLPQRVSDWLHHVASAVVLLTCHFTLILWSASIFFLSFSQISSLEYYNAPPPQQHTHTLVSCLFPKISTFHRPHVPKWLCVLCWAPFNAVNCLLHILSVDWCCHA